VYRVVEFEGGLEQARKMQSTTLVMRLGGS
jgi:hypothetical protein